VTLRKNVMTHYGPGGKMEGKGTSELFVEMVIIKEDGLDVEYVGCWEGTGLSWLGMGTGEGVENEA